MKKKKSTCWLGFSPTNQQLERTNFLWFLRLSRSNKVKCKQRWVLHRDLDSNCGSSTFPPYVSGKGFAIDPQI